MLPSAAAVGPMSLIHFGQYIHPIGSDQRQWAAGESNIVRYFVAEGGARKILILSRNMVGSDPMELHWANDQLCQMT